MNSYSRISISTNKTRQGWHEDSIYRYIPALLLLLSLSLLYFVSSCSPVFLYNTEIPANISFTIGKSIINGKVVYQDYFASESPLFYFLYAIGFLIQKTNMTGVYLLEAISLTIGLYFIYKTFLLYSGKFYALAWTIVTGALAASCISHSASSSEFAFPILSAALYLFLDRSKDPPSKNSRTYMLIQGSLAGILFLIKYNLCIFWLIPIILLLTEKPTQKSIKTFFILLLCFVAGFLTVTLPMLAYIYIKGAWSDYITSCLLYESIKESFSLGNIVTSASLMLKRQWWLFALIVFPLFSYHSQKDSIWEPSMKKALRISVILMLLCILATQRYYASNFIPLLIYMPVTAIILYPYIIKYTSDLHFKEKYFRIISVTAFLFVIVINPKFTDYVISYNHMFTHSVSGYTEMAAIMECSENKTLLSFENECILYTLSGTLPPIKYFYIPYNVRLQSKAYKEQISYIEQMKPQFICCGENIPFASEGIKIPDKILKENYNTAYFFAEKIAGLNITRKYTLYQKKINHL